MMIVLIFLIYEIIVVFSCAFVLDFCGIDLNELSVELRFKAVANVG
jgi:hypothetical protein